MSQEKTRKKSRSIRLCWFRGITSKSALSQSLRPRVGWPNDFMIQESLDGIISSTWFLHIQRGLLLLCKQIPGTRNLNIHEQGEYGSSEESKWICETRHMRALISSCPSITSIQKKTESGNISVLVIGCDVFPHFAVIPWPCNKRRFTLS